MLTWLFEIGPTQSGGMAAGPITQQELAAWQMNTGIELQSWQARFLRRLSIEYLNEQHAAAKRNHPAPWDANDIKPEMSDTQAAIRALANL